MLDPASAKLPGRILDPMDRISEVLFGLIMALSFTLTFAVATADNMAVRTMLLAALGCNLAWGIIDGGVYLLARLNQQGRAVLRWRAARDAPDAGTAQRVMRMQCHRCWRRLWSQPNWRRCGGS
jgi:hypothetical protein